jgi:hypothetical protein
VSVPSLGTLHEELSRIDHALTLDDIDGAGHVLAEYDAHLRHYIERVGAAAPLDALRQLLQIQNGLAVRMLERQRSVGEAMRRSHRAESASRAYAQVGVSL